MKIRTKTLLTTVALLACLPILATAQPNRPCAGQQFPILIVDENTLDYDDNAEVCVRPNGTFKIQLIAKNGYQLARSNFKARQKAGTIEIKDKRINAQNQLIIKVGEFALGEEPKYFIQVKDVGTLDPRVRIINNYTSSWPSALRDDLVAIDDYLVEEYSINLPDLENINAYLLAEHGMSITDVLAAMHQQ